MDRRAFLTGVGTMGAAAAGGWAPLESNTRSARAATLAMAAGAGSSRSAAKRVSGGAAPSSDGLTIGYLPRSATLLAHEAEGRAWPAHASQLRWTRWNPSFSVLAFERRVSVAIGRLHPARPAGGSGTLSMLEVVAFFALDAAPNVATFNAWRYQAASALQRATRPSSLRFDAPTPDRAALQLNYALEGSSLAPNVGGAGMLYLPLGGRDGLDVGLYVLAGPSRLTGAQPLLGEYVFSGNVDSPLARTSGEAPDFDYVALAIRPAAG